MTPSKAMDHPDQLDSSGYHQNGANQPINHPTNNNGGNHHGVGYQPVSQSAGNNHQHAGVNQLANQAESEHHQYNHPAQQSGSHHGQPTTTSAHLPSRKLTEKRPIVFFLDFRIEASL